MSGKEVRGVEGEEGIFKMDEVAGRKLGGLELEGGLGLRGLRKWMRRTESNFYQEGMTNATICWWVKIAGLAGRRRYESVSDGRARRDLAGENGTGGGGNWENPSGGEGRTRERVSQERDSARQGGEASRGATRSNSRNKGGQAGRRAGRQAGRQAGRSRSTERQKALAGSRDSGQLTHRTPCC